MRGVIWNNMTRSIDIADDLLDRVSERFGPTQLAERIEAMIERGLADPSIDALTGARSKHALDYDVYSSVDLAARDRGNYVQSFLCRDIDDFSHYVDHFGFGPSDQLLIQLADRLKNVGKPVYRHGGDKFIVFGQDDTIRTLDGLGAAVRQCVVDVNLSIDRARSKRAKSWIMFHLHQGCVQPELQGKRILCRDNAAWSSR